MTSVRAGLVTRSPRRLAADRSRVVTRLFASSESAARTTLELTGLEVVLPLYATRADAVDDVNRLGKNG